MNGAPFEHFIESIEIYSIPSVGSSQIDDEEANTERQRQKLSRKMTVQARFGQRKMGFRCSSCSFMYNQFSSISGPRLTNDDMSFNFEHENPLWLWHWRNDEEKNK